MKHKAIRRALTYQLIKLNKTGIDGGSSCRFASQRESAALDQLSLEAAKEFRVGKFEIGSFEIGTDSIN